MLKNTSKNWTYVQNKDQKASLLPLKDMPPPFPPGIQNFWGHVIFVFSFLDSLESSFFLGHQLASGTKVALLLFQFLRCFKLQSHTLSALPRKPITVTILFLKSRFWTFFFLLWFSKIYGKKSNKNSFFYYLLVKLTNLIGIDSKRFFGFPRKHFTPKQQFVSFCLASGF